jgi:short-subunit dehydrogenase
MQTMQHKLVVITGASDGIGRALTVQYLERGARVISVGRRNAEQMPPELRSDYARIDLAQPYAADLLRTFLAQREITHLDLVIHCAGIGAYGALSEQPGSEINALLATNVSAPIALTHALLPLVQAAHGQIVLIGSVAAALPVPAYAVYGATKAALGGFARSLRVELRGQVAVQIIHPGATRTDMHQKIGAPLTQLGWSRFPPPERVARQIMHTIDQGKPHAIIGIANRAIHWLGQLPGGLIDRNAARRAPQSVPRIAAPTPPHCVVTGGAAGIGWAVAQHYAQLGHQITLIDRDTTALAACAATLRTAGRQVNTIAADLAQPAAISTIIQQLAHLPPASLVVHSAGISAVGPFAHSDLAAQQAVLAVNLQAPLLLNAGMLRTGQIAADATIVLIASLSVFTGYPGASVYAASKDGLAAYARSLRAALAHQPIHVLTVFPGPTRTAHARRYSPDNRREHRRMPPEQLARLIAAAVARREQQLIPGAANRLIARIGHIAPAITEYLMRKTIFERLTQR